MKKFKLIAPIFFLLCFTLSAAAQKAIVKGVVTNAEDSSPVPFVNISCNVDGNLVGVQTDFDGNYSFELPAGNREITYSYVGYTEVKESRELVAGQETVIDVAMKASESLLDVVVVTGSKFEKKLGEETVSLEVVPPSLIENANNTQVDKAVEKVPGVTVIDGQANIRGGSGYSYGAGSRVLLLMDDLPILTGDAGFPNWDFLPIENLEQVEIIKGAASALYGSSALNGIINLRTAYPKLEPESRVTFFSGVYQKPRNNLIAVLDSVTGEQLIDAAGDKVYNEKAWWGEEHPTEAGFSLAHRQKFGQLDFVGGAYGYNETSWRQGQFSRRLRANANFRYRLTPNFSFGLNNNFQVNTSSSFLIWNGVGADAYKLWEATPRIVNEGLKITIDPFAEYFTESGLRIKALGRYYKADNLNNTNQSTFSDLYYGELQAQKRWEGAQFTLTGGVAGTSSSVEADLYINPNNPEPEPGELSKFSASNVATYLQLDKKFFDKLNVSMGVRYELNEVEGVSEAKPVGRLGINYSPAEYTFIRASIGQGYRFPTIAEKFVRTDLGTVAFDAGNFIIDVPVGIFPNPDLQSETGWSGELGFKQGLQISDWQGFIDVSGFINEYQDMMEFTFGVNEGLLGLLQDAFPLDSVVINVPGGSAAGFQSVNIGDTRILGAEVTLAGQGKLFGFPTTMLTGYTYLIPKYKVFDNIQDQLSSVDYNILKYRFRHTAKGDIQTDINKVSIGVSVQYTSFMEAIDEAFNVFLPGIREWRDNNMNGVTLVDTRIIYRPSDKDQLSFLCNNILNLEYSLRPAVIDAPRKFSIKYARDF